jgi:hypothetical protein
MKPAPHPGFVDHRRVKQAFTEVDFPHSHYFTLPCTYDVRSTLMEDEALTCTRSTVNPRGELTAMFVGANVAIAVDDLCDGMTSVWVKGATRDDVFEVVLRLSPKCPDVYEAPKEQSFGGFTEEAF